MGRFGLAAMLAGDPYRESQRMTFVGRIAPGTHVTVTVSDGRTIAGTVTRRDVGTLIVRPDGSAGDGRLVAIPESAMLAIGFDG